MINLLPDNTLFVQWLLFIAALVTLHWGIFKPVLAILKERKARTIGERTHTQALDEKALQMTTQLEKRIGEARQTGLRKKEELKKMGEISRDELLKKVRLELDQKIEGLQRQVEQESREASLQLKQYAQAISRDIAFKVLEREV